MAKEISEKWYKNPGKVVPLVVVLVAAIIGPVVYFLLNPPSPDFSISVEPIQGWVRQGGTVETEVTVECIHGYKHAVLVSVGEQPSGIVVDCALPSEELTPPYVSTVTINVGSNVPARGCKIVITGTGADGKEYPCKYTLTVLPMLWPPPTPDIQATASIPKKTIELGQEFDLIIVVRNEGDAVAKNTHVYGRAYPSGYFAVVSCDCPYKPLVPAGFDLSLGELMPGDESEVRMQLKAPGKAQIYGQYGLNVEFAFTYKCDGYPEKAAGELVFAAGLG